MPEKAPLTIEVLKGFLRARVSRFLTRETKSRAPVREILQQLRTEGLRAVFFGGAMRSLLVGKSRPRDVDLVVMGESLDELQARFLPNFRRRTRFGGLQLSHFAWHFDVWPVESTWMLQNDASLAPGFESLPYTTFFNLEAIAVEVWPSQDKGTARKIYSGDDQFFHGILNRELELNRPENPFPALCVVRSLVLGIRLGYRFGPRLSRYLQEEGGKLSVADLEEIQYHHYGGLIEPGRDLVRMLETIAEGKSLFRIAERKQLALIG